MKWQKVRELFPNQFLLVSILDYHYEGDKKVVDEVAPIRPIKDEDANEAFFNAEEGTMVYHTANEDFIIHSRKDPLMKMRKSNESPYNVTSEDILEQLSVKLKIEKGISELDNGEYYSHDEVKGKYLNG